MKLDITAENYIKSITPEDKFFRVAVMAGGCNGYQYSFSVIDAKTDKDILVGDRTVVDPRSMLFLKNSVLKYQKDLFSAQFVVTNPDAAAECGCGQSFTVKDS